MNHPDSEWLPIAQQLPVGGSRKIESSCASSPCLRIGNTPTAYTAYCFACGESRFSRKVLSMQELSVAIAARGSAEQELLHRKQFMGHPTPKVTDPREWPRAAQLWPLKAGLTFQEIQGMGLYYHAPSTRVIIPCGPSWYQARLITGAGPKYLSPAFDPPTTFSYGSGPLVLTEDCLSAYKVSLCGYRGWPVLGTKLTDARLLPMIREAKASGAAVRVWLDPDGAGRNAAAVVRRTLSMYGVEMVNVASEKDPKLHSKGEITDLLRLK